jgi:hypothetical protein
LTIPPDQLAERRVLFARCIPALNLIYLGVLFVLLDFRLGARVGGAQFGIDLLPDVVGLLLLAVGTAKIAMSGRLVGSADLVMTAVAVAAASILGWKVVSWFFPALATTGGTPGIAAAVAVAAAVSGFCYVMSVVAMDLAFERLRAGWALLAVAFFVCVTLPSVVAMLVPTLMTKGPFVVLTGTLVLVPLVGFFALLWRMKEQLVRISTSSRGSSGLV